MTMLETHDGALESISTVYHEFLLRYKSNDKIVYGLVEGKEDPMFYRSLIERHLPNEWEVELLKSGNKDKVLKALSMFDWSRFQRKRICFFVDRDLSEFAPEITVVEDNLYITDNYSIENECATFRLVKRVIEEILNMELVPDEISKIESTFEKNSRDFRNAITPLMAQIIVWKKKRCNPCLNNVNLKDYFCFKDGEIHIKQEFSNSLEMVECISKKLNIAMSSREELDLAEKDFRAHEGPEKYVRGKYLLWFVVECALAFHKSISKFSAKYKKPPKVKLALGFGNAMVNIAPRLRCPVSLENFIQQNYLSYIEKSTT